jgi:hypothetical protein
MADEERRMTIQALFNPDGNVNFGGVDGDLVDIQPGVHDVVWQSIMDRIQPYAYRGTQRGLQDGAIIGDGVWERDGDQFRLQKIEYAPNIIYQFGRENVTESVVVLPGELPGETQ